MRFFLIYPNHTGAHRVPLGCAYLYTVLRAHGHEVRFFDFTFLGVHSKKEYNAIRGKMLSFRSLDLTPYGVTYETLDKDAAFARLADDVLSFSPDVIGVTLTEDTSLFGFETMHAAKSAAPSAFTMAGGVFCMTEPELVLKSTGADAVCIGEGEICLPELLGRLEAGKDYLDVQGYWFRDRDGGIVKNEVAPPLALDKIPVPDLSFIDERHFFTPLAGNVYKAIFIEGHRGCPRRCAYCCNQVFLDTYKKYGHSFLRKKAIELLVDEMAVQKNKYNLNLFQFCDDDLTLFSENELRRFKSLYLEKVNCPFWCQVEANNLTDAKVRLLRESGCIAASMGIETGSSRILKEVYKRRTTPEVTKRGFDLMHKYGIRTSGNIIIGVPTETRKDVFESVELARKCKVNSVSVSVFIPYRGTPLREMCVEKGYIDPEFIHDGKVVWEPVIDMPQISRKEVAGLARTLSLYITLPREVFPLIERCESNERGTEELFEELERMFWIEAAARGMDVYVPGFDYSGFLEKCKKELADGRRGANGEA